MNPMNMLREMRTIKKLLTDAEVEARAMGDDQPGAEHLLLAALQLPEDSARRAFERLGVDPDDIRTAIVDQHVAALTAIGMPAGEAALSASAPLDPPTGSGIYRSTASAQEAFQAASAMARKERSVLLGAHVVTAVAAMEHGTTARVLTAIGIDRDALDAAARQELNAPRPAG